MTMESRPAASVLDPSESLATRLVHSPTAVTAITLAATLLAFALCALGIVYAVAPADTSAALSVVGSAAGTVLLPIELVMGVAMVVVWRRLRHQRHLMTAQAAEAQRAASTMPADPLDERRTSELRALLIQYYDLAADHELVLQSAADGIYRTAPDGRVTFANQAMATLLQRTLPELQGKNMHELAHYQRADGRPYPQAHCPIHNPAAATIPTALEHDILWRKDGTPLAVAVTSSPTKGLGEGGGAVVVVRDVSRRDAEQARHRQTEERYRAIVQTMPEWIWEMDARGNYTYSNPAGHRLLGYTPKELVGRSIFGIVHPDDRLGVEALLPALVAEKRGWTGHTVRWIRKDGSERVTASTSVHVVDDQGNVCGFRGSERDVTEYRANDAALWAHATVLEQANIELGRLANAALPALSESLGLAADRVQSIARPDGAGTGNDEHVSIQHAINGLIRIQELIGDMVLYTKLVNETWSAEPVVMHESITMAIDNLRAAVNERHATVVIEPMPTVMGNQARLTELFQHLIGNAIRFNENATPEVHVTAARDAEFWRFSVSDNGIGVPLEDRERIFILCHQVNPNPDEPGTGMGLAFARHVVQRHGGRIWVDPVGAAGTTISCTLPAVPSDLRSVGLRGDRYQATPGVKGSART